MMDENQKQPDRTARRREQNRSNVARYRQRHGARHRLRWAAYMRTYRAKQKLLRQQQEETPHEHRND